MEEKKSLLESINETFEKTKALYSLNVNSINSHIY